jgi:hypothetical protein
MGGKIVIAAIDQLTSVMAEGIPKTTAPMAQEVPDKFLKDLREVNPAKEADVKEIYTLSDPVEIVSYIENDPDYSAAIEKIPVDEGGNLLSKEYEDVTYPEWKAGKEVPVSWQEYLDSKGIDKFESQEQPEVIFMLGPPASGKTQTAKALGLDDTHITIDPDQAKKHIREYQEEGALAGFVHKESVSMSEGLLLGEAVNRNLSIIMSKVGKGEKTISEMMDLFKEKGYKIILMHNNLPPEESARRAWKRYFEDGRLVPAHYIMEDVGLKTKEVYDILKSKADAYKEFNANVPFGDKPQLIEEGVKGDKKSELDRRGRDLREGRDKDAQIVAKEKAKEEIDWDDSLSVVTPAAIKPTDGISRLDQKIQKLKTQEAMLESSKEALEYVKEMQNEMKGRIKPYEEGKLAEEYAGIPAKYKAKTGITMDEAASELTGIGIELTEATLPEYLTNLDAQAARLRADIKANKAPFVRMKEMTLFKQRIRDIERGRREGRVLGRSEVEAVQKQVIDALSNSELDRADKGAFLATMKNIKTQAQLDKAMPVIKERIAKVEDLRKKQAAIKKFKKIGTKKNINKLRPEFRKPVQEIVDQFDISKVSDAKVKDLGKLADYLLMYPENQVPQERIDELKRLDKTPLRDLTSDEVENVVASIQHLIKLNELKNKLIVKGKIVEHQQVVEQATFNVKKKFDQLNESISGLDSLTKIEEDKAIIKGIDGYHSNTELQAEILDGEDHGIIQEVMYSGIDKGTDVQITFEKTAKEFFKEKLAGINMDKWSAAFQVKKKDVIQTSYKIFGYKEPLKITPGEKIAFYLHTLNVQNLKHLEEGGFAFPNTPTKIIKFQDPSDIWKIANSLTKDEMTVANAMNEYLNTVGKDAINEVSVRLNGVEIALVDNYWMIRTLWLDRFQDQLLKGEMGMTAKATLEGMGIFKQRQDTANAIILEDAFAALSKHIKKVGAYVGLSEPLRSAKALLNDNEFQKAVINAGKGHFIDHMKDYLSKVEGEYLNTDGLDRITQKMINTLDLSLLGANPFIIAYQPVSYLLAQTEMAGKYLSGSYKIKPTDKEMAEIAEYMPQIWERVLGGNIGREVGEVMNVGYAKKFFTDKGAEGQWVMTGIRAADTSAVMSIVRSVKKEISEKYPDLKGSDYFEKVYEKAWEVIRRTQPTFHVKDRSPMGRKRDWFWRLATKYSSQRNKNIMMQRRAYEEYNRSHKTPKNKSDLVKKITLINVVAAGMIAGIRKVRSMIMDKDPKRSIVHKKEDASIFEEFVIEMLKVNIGNLYVLGTGFDTLMSKLQKSTYGGYDISDPVTSTANEIVDAATNAINTVVYAISNERYDPEKGRYIGEKKWKKAASKMLISSIDLSGKLYFGLPIALWRKLITAQVNRKNKRIERQLKRLKSLGL